jgi:hypothetical protein
MSARTKCPSIKMRNGVRAQNLLPGTSKHAGVLGHGAQGSAYICSWNEDRAPTKLFWFPKPLPHGFVNTKPHYHVGLVIRDVTNVPFAAADVVCNLVPNLHNANPFLGMTSLWRRHGLRVGCSTLIRAT